jgi:hypothetical protein
MGEHVTIEQRHVPHIDVASWIAQRTGTEHTNLTAALRDWAQNEDLATPHRRDWMTLAELWCAAREYAIQDGATVHHDHPWLSRPVAVARAWAGEHGAVAIVCIDGHAPRVYADITTDDGYWHQVDTLDIVCPDGHHRWTWHGHQLTTADGGSSTVTEVFGDTPTTPFTPCPGCRAYDNGDTDTPCGCDGTDIIICPHCGTPCDLQPTPVPTLPQRRPFAVLVSEAVAYQGWVMATDADNAGEEAGHLLDDGGTATGRGRLNIVHLDRDVIANDAAQVCWRCRTDPNQPHPSCSHPTAHPAGAAAPPPGLAVDPGAVTAWLAAASDEHPQHSNADALDISPAFGHGHPYFLSTVDNLVHANPDGLARRGDIHQVALWLIADGDIPDRGAIITVDLTNGLRLASTYQDARAFAGADAHGTTAALSALAHVAAQASQLVAGYQTRNPDYRPPRH